eukprot:gb/GEZN01002874.1/.p1 GENE.gb/GEZN01002874.1/~~gb/GEZN01002874.1/.p1  ORF type:complete len:683 (-),score=97.71 gb/GEZN01002874.1/:288-2300(-)
MPTYNFKQICVVPSSKDFVDIILTRTQRKTMTVVRKGWKISRVRSFYTLKIKFTQENFTEKLQTIVKDFPRIDDIHPFYGDLISVLYSKDHYKLALGHINMAIRLIEGIGKDYIRFIKTGDSLYRCKALKIAALGRMCTVMRKLNATLGYLEQVRQHLSRLPAIEPNTRTLLITGFPNVGKSSFINNISRANVDVQAYPFTTKSLFVGHTDYEYLRFQVIDTPGILDHSLEARSTIEMQAITALAHLHSTVLFFLDVSENCGHTLEAQIGLYHNIKVLFANKPLILVANKIDLRPYDKVPAEDRALLETVAKERQTQVIPMSNQTKEGVSKVKAAACQAIMKVRLERKTKSPKIEEIMNRTQIQKPVKRDNKLRPRSIPDSVIVAKEQAALGVVKPKRRTERDLEAEAGGPGVYAGDHRKYYILDNPEWKYDTVPEIIDGLNIADCVDLDIDKRLRELEEEEAKEAEGLDEMEGDGDSELDEPSRELVGKIKKEQFMRKVKNDLKTTNNKPHLPRHKRHRKAGSIAEDLEAKGYEVSALRSRSLTRVKRQKTGDGDGAMEVDGEVSRKPKIKKSHSRSRSKSTFPLLPGETEPPKKGYRSKSRPRAASVASRSLSTPAAYTASEKLEKLAQGPWVRGAPFAAGEADRRRFPKLTKHMMTGKRGIGKTDRR